MWKIIGSNHIPNSLIEPLSPSFMRMFRVPEHFAETPKITFIATVCMSLYNNIHAGFKLLFFDTVEQETEAALRMIRRMNAESPLLHQQRLQLLVPEQQRREHQGVPGGAQP